MFDDDDMLMLSGIQHYAFCPRQWALIHIEQVWVDNRLTAEGNILHKHVDDPFYRQKMGDHICLRSVNIASRELGLYGISDIVELHHTNDSQNAITHPDYLGLWLPYPVEYKHGKQKYEDVDRVQLAAQAICIEELYHIVIPLGAIYYGTTHRREEVSFTNDLRDYVKHCAKAMHETYKIGKIPLAEPTNRCKNCSLIDICMPETAYSKSASKYLKHNLYEETP